MKTSFKTLLIEPLTLADILLAIELCATEISGLARVRETEEGLRIFDEPVIFKQKCSAGGTEFDIEAHGLWNHEMMRARRGHEINEFRLWWHSHVFSAAYFSKIDNAQIESWNDSPAEWWTSLVANKFGQLKVQVDLYKPERLTVVDPDIKSTEKMDKESLRALMLSRRERMEDIIRKRVNFDDKNSFEKILKGVFHEE